MTRTATTALVFATRNRTRDPLHYVPADHGHALILAPPESGRSSMLRSLVRQALVPAPDHTVRVAVLAPLAGPTDWAREYAAGARVAWTLEGQNALVGDVLADLADRQATGWDPDTGAARWLVFVDDADELPDEAAEGLARLGPAGAAVGVHLVVVSPGPVPALVDEVDEDDDEDALAPFGFRAARRLSLSLVRRLVAGSDRLTPAPMAHGRWLVRTPDEGQALVWERWDI